MTDYGNSNKSKENADKKIVKVVTGEVVVKEPSVGSRFRHIFFGGDLTHSLRIVAADVILPATRDLVVDAIVNAVKGVIYGESGMRRRRTPEYGSRTVYNNPVVRSSYSNVRQLEPRRGFLPDQQPHPYRTQKVQRGEILCANKQDAERVVETLIEIVDQYHTASLADLYGLMGVDSTPIDHKWGWSYLNNVQIRQTQDGWLIDLPELEVV